MPKDDLKTGVEAKDGAKADERLDKIIKQLEENAICNREILSAVKFLKSYFLWTSIYNTIKVLLLLAIIVLGIISWDSIVNSVIPSIYG